MATNIEALPVRLQIQRDRDPHFANRPDSMILLTELEVAAFLSLAPETLRTWRSRNKYDITVVKMGTAVRYTWEETQRLLREGVS